MIPIELDRLRERGLLGELAYPSRDLGYAEEVLGELERIGVEYLFIREGDRAELVKLGKGYRGLVLLGVLGGVWAAVKILRTDAGIEGLEREAEATLLANTVGVGPRLYAHSRHVLAMEVVEGVSFDKWIEELEAERVDELRAVLGDCFRQARLLDKLLLDHGELSDAKRHIVIRPDLRPVILDFGKASARRRPSNVTSLLSYISFGPHSGKIMKMLRLEKPPLDKSRGYKRSMSDDAFLELLRGLNLD